MSKEAIHIIGGGLAGSEAAWQAAEAGAQVVLHEMRPVRETEVHETDSLAELVCSNSFRSDDWEYNAVGLLHQEMRLCGSLIMRSADKHKLPAGGALAVDRHGFSSEVQHALEAHPNVNIVREEILKLPAADDWSNVIIATGPLTSPDLAQAIQDMTGEDELAFFDAIAPIVYKDSIDFDVAWFQSRYDKGGPGGDGADYINCPLNKEQYETLVQALVDGEKTEFKDWEKSTPYFDGCLPIEVMAERGPETLRHGPMKPVGLTNPHSDEKPYAVVQLRQDNALGSLYNMVGCQTKLKHGEQKRIFRTIPGLEGAAFARLGGLHRNTFLNSPKVLDEELRLRSAPHIRFAGQITGVEGYLESAAIGLLAGRYGANQQLSRSNTPPPLPTALGALANHITSGADSSTFQPMNINYGLLPDLQRDEFNPRDYKGKERARARKRAKSERALRALQIWLNENDSASEVAAAS